MNSIPPLSERCRAEATRDVVFLFQRCRIVVFKIPDDPDDDGEFQHDGEGICLGDTDERGCWRPRHDSEYLTNRQLVEMECAYEEWDTEGVWLSREEANAFGERYHYNYRDGWRVYGIPSNGLLAEAIKQHDSTRQSAGGAA